jgi:hypothetical protein
MEAHTWFMNFLTCFLMWFPACALFVAIAYRTEMAWLAEDRLLRRRLAGVGTLRGRPVLRQEDGAPLMFLD